MNSPHGRLAITNIGYLSPSSSQGRPSPAEVHADEERRLAHVAATRAKDFLVLSSIEMLWDAGTKSEIKAKRSSFEQGLPKSAVREQFTYRKG